MTQFLRLREDVVGEMPWTIAQLEPLILPYIPSKMLPGMGYITASLHTRNFILLVQRQILKNKSDYIFSVTSTCCPKEHFPFGVAIQAIAELSGIEYFEPRTYDTLVDLDYALQVGFDGLRTHLSCENFGKTRLLMTRLLNEAMAHSTRAS
jgi:hypothetical protein